MPRGPRRVRAADAVAEAVARCAARPGDLVLIGIDGRGASGKSTLAGAIAAAVPGAQVIHVDDFWGPSIAEWDWPRFRSQVLLPLLAGQPARYQICDWVRDAGGEWAGVEPGRPVIVEGVSAIREEVGAPWDLTIVVDAPRSVRLARAEDRDGTAAMPRWLDYWMPSEERYLAAQAPQQRCDLLVDGTDDSLRTR